jgi:hypothetical protein
VGQRFVVRPIAERRPANGVMTTGGILVEDVLEHRAAPVARGVVGAVDERVGCAEAMPRLAAVRLPAQELECHAMHVPLEQPGHLAVDRRARARASRRVDLDLGVGGAAGCLAEGEAARVPRRTRGHRHQLSVPGDGELPAFEPVGDRERSRALVDRPVGGVAGLGGRLRQVALRREEIPRRSVEEVAAERGRLHPKRLGVADSARGRHIRAPALGHESADGLGAQAEAAAGDRVAVELCGRRAGLRGLAGLVRLR